MIATRNQVLFARSGWAVMVSVFVGWVVVAGFVPPPSPADSAHTVARRFADDATQIRIGLVICLFGAGLLLPWYATIAAQVKRIEGPQSPIAYVQLAAGACLVIEFLVPLIAWLTAAYRTDGPDAAIQHLDDLGWFCFLGLVSTTMISCITFALAVLQDRRPTPVFPRWLAYFNLWAAAVFAPAELIFFFKSGAFSWAGVISFWLVFVAFFAWMVVMTIMLTRAVRAEPGGSLPAPLDNAELTARVEALTAEVARLSG